jgi:hypothetical protein
MRTTSAAGQRHSDAANRSTGATRPLFAGHACPCPAAEAPAGPARRARRASPRSTPRVCGLLFCHAGHRPKATAALAHRGKRNAAPCCSGLRAVSPRLLAIARAGKTVLGLRCSGSSPGSRGGVSSGAWQHEGHAVSKDGGVPFVGAIDRAPSHAAPAPAASAWYVSPSAPPCTPSSLASDDLRAALSGEGGRTTLQAKHH